MSSTCNSINHDHSSGPTPPHRAPDLRARILTHISLCIAVTNSDHYILLCYVIVCCTPTLEPPPSLPPVQNASGVTAIAIIIDSYYY